MVLFGELDNILIPPMGQQNGTASPAFTGGSALSETYPLRDEFKLTPITALLHSTFPDRMKNRLPSTPED
jgi:hypothetical protein